MQPTRWISYRSRATLGFNIKWWALEDFLRAYPPHERVPSVPTDKWALDWGRDARGWWVRVAGLEIDQGY